MRPEAEQLSLPGDEHPEWRWPALQWRGQAGDTPFTTVVSASVTLSLVISRALVAFNDSMKVGCLN